MIEIFVPKPPEQVLPQELDLDGGS
jgi:hypothetical protein